MRLAPRMMLRPAGGGMQEREFRIVRPDGSVRWLVSRARPEEIDGRRLVFGVTIDITERRLAEQALRSADERAALAARSAGIGTWEVDFETQAERWDEQMFRLRGLAPRAHPPQREERLAMLHPDDRERNVDASARSMRDRWPLRYEFRVLLPDGSVRWLASRSIPVLDAQGRVARRIGVNWDITDRLRRMVRDGQSLEVYVDEADVGRIKQGLDQLGVPETELADALQREFGVRPLNILYEWVATAGRARLRVVFERYSEAAGFWSGPLQIDGAKEALVWKAFNSSPMAHLPIGPASGRTGSTPFLRNSVAIPNGTMSFSGKTPSMAGGTRAARSLIFLPMPGCALSKTKARPSSPSELHAGAAIYCPGAFTVMVHC